MDTAHDTLGRLHEPAARLRAGATEAEVAEAMSVVIVLNGGPAPSGDHGRSARTASSSARTTERKVAAELQISVAASDGTVRRSGRLSPDRCREGDGNVA